jgi:hypothetical protein
LHIHNLVAVEKATAKKALLPQMQNQAVPTFKKGLKVILMPLKILFGWCVGWQSVQSQSAG